MFEFAYSSKSLNKKEHCSGEDESFLSNDWPVNFAEIRVLDNLLRCLCCYDYISTAMILPNCQHNFCSLCIRKYLCYKTQCPACSAAVSEPELRNNRLLDSVIEQYKNLRKPLQQILKSKASYENKITDHCLDDTNEKSSVLTEKPVDNNLSTEVPSSKNADSEIKILEDDSEQLSLKFTDYESDSDFQEDETNKDSNGKPGPSFNNIFPSTSGKKSESFSLISLKTVKEKEDFTQLFPREEAGKTLLQIEDNQPCCSTPVNNSRVNSKVDCPVCGVSVRQDFINKHLDNCLNKSDKKESLRSSSKKKRLTKLVYHLMNDKDIRNKLKEIGLSAEGERKELIKRHKDFQLLHNSDCDLLNPTATPELIKSFEKNEKLRKKLSVSSKERGLHIGKNSNERIIRKAQKSYAKKYKSQFSELIQQAKIKIPLKDPKLQDISHETSENISEKDQNVSEIVIDGEDVLSSKPYETGESLHLPPPPREIGEASDLCISRQVSTSSFGSFDLFPDNHIEQESTAEDNSTADEEYRDESSIVDGISYTKTPCRKSLFKNQTNTLSSPVTKSTKIVLSPGSLKYKTLNVGVVDDSDSDSDCGNSQKIDNSVSTSDEHVSELWPALSQKTHSSKPDVEEMEDLIIVYDDSSSDIIPIGDMEPPSIDCIKIPTRLNQKEKQPVVRRSGRQKRKVELGKEDIRSAKRHKKF